MDAYYLAQTKGSGFARTLALFSQEGGVDMFINGSPCRIVRRDIQRRTVTVEKLIGASLQQLTIDEVDLARSDLKPQLSALASAVINANSEMQNG